MGRAGLAGAGAGLLLRRGASSVFHLRDGSAAPWNKNPGFIRLPRFRNSRVGVQGVVEAEAGVP